MKCKLCNEEIINYDSRFNSFKIDDSKSVDVCRDCSDKFVKWQGNILRDLFPTKMMKKRFDKN